MSTFIFGGPPAGLSFSFPRSSVARCTPSCASAVARVLANGLYGARIVPAGTGGGIGSAPSEFRWLFSIACWRSVDVAFVAATSSGLTVTGGGGGDPVFPSDNRRGRSGESTGDCGGEMICTRFLGFPFFVLGGAVAFLSQSLSESVQPPTGACSCLHFGATTSLSSIALSPAGLLV